MSKGSQVEDSTEPSRNINKATAGHSIGERSLESYTESSHVEQRSQAWVCVCVCLFMCVHLLAAES